MRPLELTLRNFRSFSGETRFDFRDRRLLGIVGPIGAGKSTILDAISYALYARTPRVASSIRDLIHQRNDTAIVSLSFDVDGETWQVTRSIRKSQSSHTLQHLDDEGHAVETLTQKTDVDRRIEELIGLDFDGFSRSVLLAQGRFAEFLSAQPAQRDRVLKGVFGHERIDKMRQVAKERVTASSLDIEKLSGRLEALASAEQRLVEQREDHAALSERLEALEKVKPRVDDLDERLAAMKDRTVLIAERGGALARRLAELPPPTAIADTVADVERATARRSELAATLTKHQEELQVAETALEELTEGAATLDEAGELLTRRGAIASRRDERKERLAAVEASHAKMEQAQAEAIRRHEQAESAVEEHELALAAATEQERDARTALERARHDNMAHALRGQLVGGEPCPVCAQTVTAVPDEGDATDLTRAEAALREASTALEAARSAARDRQGVLAAAVAEVATVAAQLAGSQDEMAGLRADLERTESEFAAITGQLASLVGEGEPAEVIKRRREALREARDTADLARKSVDRARTGHDQAIRDEQTASKQLAEIRLTAARVASALDVPFETATESAADLATALESLRAVLDVERIELDDERKRLEEERTAVTDERTEVLASVGVAGDLATEITSLASKLETIADQIARVEKDLAAQDDDRARLAGLEHRRSLFARIASDLTDAKFVRFLLDDERIRLGDLASDHFQRLSSGRYRFTSDGKFGIVDLATADVERKADSLSGGETFLASLSLALGLAEMVARSGGRLEAFFLDEGFGTLDPEHLNLAMEGIERLVADATSRLVVVVSHVPELRQRIEDLIELDKHPLTGDTVVLKA